MQTFATIETTEIFTRNNQAFCVVVDVSRSGISLRTGQPPELGHRVFVRIGIGEEIRRLEAIVRRLQLSARGVFLVGLEWHGCHDDDLSFVDEFTALQSGS